jgi:outer membrane receptor protein involved in Fe transport
MKYLCLSLLCLSISFSLIAQIKPATYQVKGQVVEKLSGDGVPFATVIIQNDSIKENKAQPCDASGHFSLNLSAPGNYILRVSSVGYRGFSMPIIVSEIKTDLGKLTMESGVELNEVTVTAQKPLVKVEPDKIVYSMESDPESQTSNVMQMLYKIPLVTVDAEDNITINGNSNFKILINGKSSSMMSTNFKDVLKSLPANTIKDIEVITNPSSKYDAEGVGGILNIITTKKAISGITGSVSTGIDARGSFNGSAYLAAKINKFTFSTRYYGSQFIQPRSQTESSSEYFNNTDYHYSSSEGNNSYKGLSNGFSGEASYEIDTLNLISLSFWGYQGSYRNNGFSETQYMSTTDDITRLYTNTTNSKNSYGSLSGNIDYQRTYKKPDKSLTFSYKLDNNPSTTKYLTTVNGITNFPSYLQSSQNDAVGREQTFQADYYDPLTPMHQAEAGIKFILRQNTSTSETYRNDTVKLDNENNLDYNQYILGAYAGYVIKWKKLTAKTGLRLERTWNDGTSITSGVNTDFTNRLFNLVPYITFSYMPKPGRTIKLSYTQRLSRPGIWYLNPYVNNTDSLNIRYGNPSLNAEIAHSFELGYTYFSPKFNFSATSSASFINNSIESISSVESNGATITTYKNIGKDQSYGLSLYLGYRPTSKLSIFFNGGGRYIKMAANNGYAISNEGFNYNSYMGGRWTIWKELSLSTSIGLFSTGVNLQGKGFVYYYTSFGVSQYLLKRKLMLSLSATDPFWYQKNYSYESKDITFSSAYKYIYRAQNFRFSLSFNFGKMDTKVKKARRGIQNNDLKSKDESQAGAVQQ